MNTWLVVIVLIMVIGYLLDCLTSALNLKALDPHLPDEFVDVYDQDEYQRSQAYTRDRTRFSLVSSSCSTFVTLFFLLIGGFNYVDIFARSFEYGSIVTGIIYTGGLMFLSFVFGLPFSIYSTFVLEERYNFNTTTPKTFVLDILKSTALAIVIGVPLLALILWFFETTGEQAWLYCWALVVAFSLVMHFLAPVLIMPLFNKFFPLEDGPLKESILAYAQKEEFAIQGIFTMDGSKRSTKLNAFFTGFGRFRKIVFYDTLMDKLTDDEIVAVLAHEMGHFKLKHIMKMLAGSVLQTGLMFYLLSVVLNNASLFAAVGMEHVSVYASIVFFGILYSPVNMLVSTLFCWISRHHEFEADAYTVKSTGHGEHLISGLKKLSQANLSNLTPHPVTVILEYTHPPVLQRIQAIKKLLN